jgi:serine/threonine protein kinase
MIEVLSEQQVSRGHARNDRETQPMIVKTTGHYRITSKLGTGGMGEVFLSEDARLKHKEVITFLPANLAGGPTVDKRFLKKARPVATPNHPHVYVVHDVGETDDGIPFTAMEFNEGGSLDSVLIPFRPGVTPDTQNSDR